MHRGSIGRRTSDGSSGAAALEIIAPAAGNGCYLKEMQVSLAAATASTYGLGRPAAKGVTPTTPVRILADSGGDAFEFETLTAIAWGTGPTVPAAFYRRLTFPAVIGSMYTWTFANGLFIPAGGTLVLWNLAANGVADVNLIIDEN